MRALAEYVMRERKHAILMALLFAVIPLCGWLSLSIIGLVTLRKGPAEGLFVLMWAALPAVVAAVMGQPYFLLDGVVLGSLVVWGMALALRATQSWASVMQLAVFCAMLGLIAAFAVHPDLPAHLENYFNVFLQRLLKKSGAAYWELGLSEAAVKQLIHLAAQIWMGVYAAMALFGNLCCLWIARWMQALLYNPGGLKAEGYQIRLGLIANGVLLVTALGVWSKHIVALNILPVVVLPFVVAGFSLLYRVSAITDKQMFWLAGCYTFFILLLPYSILLMVLIAFIDSCVDISRYIELKKIGR